MHAETTPRFLPKFQVGMIGKFSQTCKPFNPPKNWHWNIVGIFFHNWDPLYVLLRHSEILREIQGKFPCGNILGDPLWKRGEISTQKILLYFSSCNGSFLSLVWLFLSQLTYVLQTDHELSRAPFRVIVLTGIGNFCPPLSTAAMLQGLIASQSPSMG